jgi:hypothetical protein
MVDPGLFQPAQFLPLRADHLQVAAGGFGIENFARMGLERHQGRYTAGFPCNGEQPVDDRPVTGMHAIERSCRNEGIPGVELFKAPVENITEWRGADYS